MDKSVWRDVSGFLFYGMIAGWLVCIIAYFAKADDRFRKVVRNVSYLLTLAFLFVALTPPLISWRLSASRTQRLSHVRAVVIAAQMYGAENDDRFHLASNWKDALQPYWQGSNKLSDANPTTGKERWLEFNRILSGAHYAHLFEPTKSAMFAGGVGITERSEIMVIVGFCDGHASAIKQEKFSWGTRETLLDSRYEEPSR